MAKTNRNPKDSCCYFVHLLLWSRVVQEQCVPDPRKVPGTFFLEEDKKSPLQLIWRSSIKANIWAELPPKCQGYLDEGADSFFCPAYPRSIGRASDSKYLINTLLVNKNMGNGNVWPQCKFRDSCFIAFAQKETITPKWSSFFLFLQVKAYYSCYGVLAIPWTGT